MSFLWKGITTWASSVEKGAENFAGGIKDLAVNGAEFVPNLVGSAAVCIEGKPEKCRKQSTRALNNLLGAGGGLMKASNGLVDGTIGAGVGYWLTVTGELAKDVGLPGVGNALESKTANTIVNIAAQIAIAASRPRPREAWLKRRIAKTSDPTLAIPSHLALMGMTPKRLMV